MTFGRFSILAAMVLALAACQTKTPGQEPAPSSATMPGPPSSNTDLRRPSVSIAQAVQVFDNVCVSQAPTFGGSPAAAVENGLTRRGEHGSYAHPTANLRVMLDGPTCMMAFSSDEDRQDVERELTSLGTPSMPVGYRAMIMPPPLNLEFGDVLHTVSVTAL